MSNEPRYPEHIKLGAVKNESQIIGEFVEALPGLDLYLCERDSESYTDDRYFPAIQSTQTILAQYFGIDLKKIDQEKQHMLDAIREKNRINDAMERDQ